MDKLLLAVSLRSALIEGPVNCLVIAVKYDRDALMFKKITNHLSILGNIINQQNIVDHIIIVITNSDKIKNDSKASI